MWVPVKPRPVGSPGGMVMGGEGGEGGGGGWGVGGRPVGLMPWQPLIDWPYTPPYTGHGPWPGLVPAWAPKPPPPMCQVGFRDLAQMCQVGNPTWHISAKSRNQTWHIASVEEATCQVWFRDLAQMCQV
jgi:hypothetical protein